MFTTSWSFVAFLMVFPFLYMFFTSLKQTQDVYHSPPRLLPYSADTIERDGKQVSVYEFEINGQKHQMVIDDAAGVTSFGFFTTADQLNGADPQSSSGLQQIKLADAKDTGTTQTVGSNKFAVYTVTVAGQSQELLLAYKRGLKRFVDVKGGHQDAFRIDKAKYYGAIAQMLHELTPALAKTDVH